MTKDQNHPAQQNPSPEGGDKDTNSLHDIKGVQQQDMLDKGEEVDQKPESVKGTDVGHNGSPQSR
ncbi:hypothetical protein [Deinococcus radiophilus]|uniref:Uncharacterized protein n=1 Tax=Deinococcus radiophilus TaxID=32062 RepID=A0A3S0KNM3_9DEIO|nr:hypothetical protein [Deinococcus radiophilus]RTR30878.1 hypothetical protein EJ104_01095 [Deinococcus radiophilus]UFA49459.1 hypothetical protein LMT64_05965 [Deinococcus radiophilus]